MSDGVMDLDMLIYLRCYRRLEYSWLVGSKEKSLRVERASFWFLFF